MHRFAITFHRQLRGKSAFQSILDEIPGIGEKRKKQPLKAFGSVKKMKEASIEEFRKIGIPANVAEELKQRLEEQNGNTKS